MSDIWFSVPIFDEFGGILLPFYGNLFIRSFDVRF